MSRIVPDDTIESVDITPCPSIDRTESFESRFSAHSSKASISLAHKSPSLVVDTPKSDRASFSIGGSPSSAKILSRSSLGSPSGHSPRSLPSISPSVTPVKSSRSDVFDVNNNSTGIRRRS